MRGMVGEGRDAVAVLTQVRAVQGALNAAAYMLIDHQARHCLDVDDPADPAGQARLGELISALEGLLNHAAEPRHELEPHGDGP